MVHVAIGGCTMSIRDERPMRDASRSSLPPRLGGRNHDVQSDRIRWYWHFLSHRLESPSLSSNRQHSLRNSD